MGIPWFFGGGRCFEKTDNDNNNQQPFSGFLELIDIDGYRGVKSQGMEPEISSAPAKLL